MELKRATYSDAIELGVMMRSEDREEVWASNKLTPEKAAILSIQSSLVAYAVRYNGVLWMAYGVAPLGYREGVSPWMLATDELERHAVTFYRQTRKHVAAMLHQYRYLENYVYDKNTFSKQWLQWLGFRMDDPAPYGPLGKLFCRFSMGG